MSVLSFIGFFTALVFAPLLSGIINRVKAKVSGRNGRPLLQLYYDLWKLLHKGAVYPKTSSWVFVAGPSITLVVTVTALCLLPFGSNPAMVSFSGDFILLAYLLAMGRFATMLAALDTGSAFEGMGASREATFGAMAEPVFLLSLLALAFRSGTYSLSGILGHTTFTAWSQYWPALCLVGVALFLLLLLENCRIPADDPTTHLELTMIHEVMILDHGGPDLAFIEYAAALKLWLFSSIICGALIPYVGPVCNSLFTLAGVFMCSVFVGIVESGMARFRMERVPNLPAMAGILAALAFLLLWR